MSADGHVPIDRGVEVVLGEHPSIELVLEALPATLRVEGVGVVRVDGVGVGEAPWQGAVEAGEHVVELQGARVSVAAVRGETTRVTLAARSEEAPADATPVGLEGEALLAIGAIPPGSAGTGVVAGIGGRAGVGVRVGASPIGVVLLEGAASAVPDRTTTWLGALRVRGGVDVGLAGPLRMRLSGALGLGLLSLPLPEEGACEGASPRRIVSWIEPEFVPCASPQLGLSTSFELALAVHLPPVELVVVPVALEVWAFNPLGIVAFAPAIGVRLR